MAHFHLTSSPLSVASTPSRSQSLLLMAASCATSSISGCTVPSSLLLAPHQCSLPRILVSPPALCKSSTIYGRNPARLITLSLPVQMHSSSLPIRALSSEETSTETSAPIEELLSDLKSKWDAIENKPIVFAYGGGALFCLWFSSAVVSAINSVPLLPKVMELVGLGYTGWFVYRYLLFKESRKELALEIEEIKSKITGTKLDG